MKSIAVSAKRTSKMWKRTNRSIDSLEKYRISKQKKCPLKDNLMVSNQPGTKFKIWVKSLSSFKTFTNQCYPKSNVPSGTNFPTQSLSFPADIITVSAVKKVTPKNACSAAENSKSKLSTEMSSWTISQRQSMPSGKSWRSSSDPNTSNDSIINYNSKSF